MKTLILSCNTGEGHNSCAKAIQEVYDKKGEECHVADALGFISKAVSGLVSYWFVGIYRHAPGLFRFGYRYAEQHPAVFHETSGIYHLLTAGAKRMCRYIRDGGYDSVICTHVFSALMLTDMLKKYPLPIATSFVATDYTCSPSCGESDLDVYFIPDEALKDHFASCGVPEEKLIASGIPVRQEFFRPADKAAARRHIGLPAGCRHLLIMGGSMGCGPIRKLVRLIAAHLPKDCHVTVICGTNRRLRKRLERDHASQARIHMYGFRKDISTIMDSADLYLTKPGGISVTEAALKDLPMVFVNAVAGCEDYNRDYYVRAGCAAVGAATDEVALTCLSLLSDDTRREEMKKTLEDRKKQNAAQEIYTCMSRLTGPAAAATECDCKK